jgi:LysR family carnitine catabolism transcriptional activator
MRIKATLRQLEIFLSIAELRSFTEAGRALNVSQPALSRTIRQTEAAVGARLFDRDTRNVELTPAGRELIPIAKRIVGEFESSFGELAQFVNGRVGHITIAALPSIAASLLPDAIRQFRYSHPKVDILIRDDMSHVITEAVNECTVEIGIGARPSPRERVIYRPLLSDEFALVCRNNDPLLAKAEASWSIFEERPFVAMINSSSVRALTDATFLQLGLEVKPLYECAHVATAGNLIAAGLGVSALPRLTLPLIASSGVAAIPLERPVIKRSIGLITRPGRSLPPAAQCFLDILQQTLRIDPVVKVDGFCLRTAPAIWNGAPVDATQEET